MEIFDTAEPRGDTWRIKFARSIKPIKFKLMLYKTEDKGKQSFHDLQNCLLECQKEDFFVYSDKLCF